MFHRFFDAWPAMALPWTGGHVQDVSGSRFSHGLYDDGKHALRYRLFIPVASAARCR